MEAEDVPSALTLEHKPERIIRKVPGNIPPVPKEKGVALGDLSKSKLADLKELLERQNKILSNKFLVNKLADKGKKVSELKEKIEKELKSRDEVDKAANILSEMSLTQLNALEWTGHCKPGYRKDCHHEDPEHEETNPLKIFASHSSTTDRKKQISIQKPESSLIKPEDLFDFKDKNDASNNAEKSTNTIGKLSNNQVDTISNSSVSQSHKGVTPGGTEVEKKQENISLPSSSHSRVPRGISLDEPEPFAHFICNRYGQRDSKERFKLNKPLKPFTGTFPFKPPGRVSTKPKRWEETNVTPPPFLHGDTKLLSLEESIDIQREQSRKLKEIQIKHATEKLASQYGIQITEEISAGVMGSMAYRQPTETNSDSEEELNEAVLEDQELHDEDQMDRGGTVVYNIES